MTVTITHTQTKSVTAAGLFSVQDTVTAAVNVDENIYVFKTEDESFSRVASPGDIETFPVSRATAQLMGTGFYRLNAVTQVFSVLTTAAEFADLVNSRIKTLCVQQNAFNAGFAGSTTTTVSS